MGPVCSNGEQREVNFQKIRPKSEHYVQIQPPKSKILGDNQEVPRKTELFSSSVQQIYSGYPSSQIMNQGEKICGSCPKSDSYSGEPESIKSSNDLYNKSRVGSQEQGTGSQIVEPFEKFKENDKVNRNRSPDLLVKKEQKVHSNLLPIETGGGEELSLTT